MSDRRPAVTIGLPVYNGAEHIAEALDSLLAQSFTDFEILVSDNASSDATAEIVDAYASRDARVSLHRQPENIGAAGNYEWVLRQARGRYFMWAAHDDGWAENWLDVLVSSIGGEDVGVRGLIQLERDGEVIAVKRPPDFRKGQWISCFMRNEVDFRSHYQYCLFDRARVLQANLDVLHVDYYPDALFCYEALKWGGLRTVEGTCHRYRVHAGSMGSALSGQWRGWAKIVYRIHPARYYRLYWQFTPGLARRSLLLLLIPCKHVYAQASYWWRGARQLVTGVEYI